MILLKNEFNSIGNNFNQGSKKTPHIKPEFKFKNCLISCEADRKILLQKAEEIETKITEIFEKCPEDKDAQPHNKIVKLY